MKRGRLPLTSLRSFEAAGRLSSFTLAAAELYVSQAAISRQIRELEQALGTPLFARHHRAVELTPAGTALLAVLTAAFDRIDETLSGIAAHPSAQTVTVNCEPSFAGCWLVPHLQHFRSAHPQIDVTVETDARLIEFRAHGADLAIRHSATHTSWPRTEAAHLYDVRIVPMAAPQVLDAAGPLARPQDLAGHVLLHEENSTLWSCWFAAAGTEDPGSQRGPVFADGSMLLQAALRGHGVALLDTVLAGEDLAAGRLRQPFEPSLSYGAYWLVARDFRHLPPAAATFATWLQACFGAGAQTA